MESNEFRRIKALFDQLADLPEAERADILERNVEISETTRRNLCALLDADVQLAGATARRAVSGPFAPASVWIGRRIGAYVLERELGRGGMGNVFLGYRADGSVEQKVAVKLIRSEQLDEHTLARFRLERQVLALLKHPHIATLLDVGELDDGTPYVVMEYIEGQPIVEFARKLELKQRLRLFIEICDAVSYAHRNMVVHRDLKSSNILVTPQGQTKLLDFGIAKPLQQRFGTQEIVETGAAQRFFSPYNASPEQLRGIPITVGCDVYGLGVLLYELLAQATPFEFFGKTADEIQRLILETEPPLPSARAELMDAALARSLRGDLDAIAQRALRKTPEDRYTTVEQFADDVRNYLEGRPVTARRGRFGYRARKFIGRHRIALGIAALFLLLIGSAGVVLWMQALEVVRQRDRAVHAMNFLVGTFQAADPEKAFGEKLTAKQILDQAERSLAAEANMAPMMRAELLANIAEVKAHVGTPPEIIALVAQALDNLGKEPRPDVGILAKLLDIEAHAALVLGQYKVADSALQDAAQLDIDAGTRASLENDEIDLLSAQGATEALRPHLNRALNELVPQLAPGDSRRWKLLINIANGEEIVDGADKAIPLLEDMIRNHGDQMGEVYVLKSKFDLAGMYDDAHRPKEAEDLLDSLREPMEILYGRDSITVASWANEMANVLQKEGNYRRALSLYDFALANYKTQLGPKSPHSPNIRFNMAGAAEGGELWEEAEKNYLESIRLATEILPETNENVEMFRTAYGLFLNQRHRFTDAVLLFATVAMRAERDPEFRNDDVFKAAQLGQAIALYAADPTPARLAEYQKFAALPQDASFELKEIARQQIGPAKFVGLPAADVVPTTKQ